MWSKSEMVQEEVKYRNVEIRSGGKVPAGVLVLLYSNLNLMDFLIRSMQMTG